MHKLLRRRETEPNAGARILNFGRGWLAKTWVEFSKLGCGAQDAQAVETGAHDIVRWVKALGTGKGAQVAGQSELVHAVAVRANMRSILVAMMKSFSCSPLIFLVCRDTVALPQPKLMFG